MSIRAALALVLILAGGCARQRGTDEIRAEVDRLFATVSGEHGLAEQAALADRLEALGPDAIPSIESYVQHKPGLMKTLALISLKRITDKPKGRRFDSEDVERYLGMLTDQDVMVRTYAMESLIAAGPPFEKQIRRFQEQSPEPVRGKLDIVLWEIEGSGRQKR